MVPSALDLTGQASEKAVVSKPILRDAGRLEIFHKSGSGAVWFERSFEVILTRRRTCGGVVDCSDKVWWLRIPQEKQ